VAGEVVDEGGRFTRIDRDAALRELHESLRHALGEDEMERRQLSKALLPHVRRFYAGYFDPEAHAPYLRLSSRVSSVEPRVADRCRLYVARFTVTDPIRAFTHLPATNT
jgi:hypothetical protein